MLLGFAVVGGVDAYFEANAVGEPGWWGLVSTIVMSGVIFAWYYLDSEARSFPRSKWLNIAVVGVALVAIPYYVARSAEQGRRLTALVKLAGFTALCFGFEALGQMAGAAVG